MKNDVIIEGIVSHLDYMYKYNSSGGDDHIEERMLFVLKFGNPEYKIDCIIEGKKAKKYLGKLKAKQKITVFGELAVGEKEKAFVVIKKIKL